MYTRLDITDELCIEFGGAGVHILTLLPLFISVYVSRVCHTSCALICFDIMAESSNAVLSFVRIDEAGPWWKVTRERSLIRDVMRELRNEDPIRVDVYALANDDEDLLLDEDDDGYGRPNARVHLTRLFAEKHGLHEVDSLEEVGEIVEVLGDGHCLHRAFMTGLFENAVKPLYLFGQELDAEGARARAEHFEHLRDNCMSSWRFRLREHFATNAQLFISNDKFVRGVDFSDLERCTYIDIEDGEIKEQLLESIWNEYTNFNMPVPRECWNGKAAVVVLCHFWKQTIVHYSTLPRGPMNCWIAYWCTDVCKVRVHEFDTRFMTPPEGAICLHHTGNHYRLVRTISRSCSQGQLYEMIKMNFN